MKGHKSNKILEAGNQKGKVVTNLEDQRKLKPRVVARKPKE